MIDATIGRTIRVRDLEACKAQRCAPPGPMTDADLLLTGKGPWGKGQRLVVYRRDLAALTAWLDSHATWAETEKTPA